MGSYSVVYHGQPPHSPPAPGTSMPLPRLFSGRGLPLWIALAALSLPPLAAAQEPPPPELEELLSPITRDRVFRTSKVAVQMVDVQTGEVVFERQGDRQLSPASTMKVVTAAAALRTMGPAFRYETDLRARGGVDGEGTLRGELFVHGTGDPTLVVEDLWKLVYDLKLAGVERIQGDVVFDESFMGQDYPLPGWDKQEDIERGPSYFPALGALSLNFNTATLVVGPGAAAGQPARVTLETPAPGVVEVESEVVTAPSGGRTWLTIDREVDGSKVRFTVKGSVADDDDARRYYRTVPEPTAHFMAAFGAMLEAQGIKVTGKLVRGQVPERGTRLLVQRRSEPLASILMDMNKYSNNFMAEQVLRTMGAEVHGVPGTTDKGLQVVADYLREIGVADDGYTLVNGSGLTREGFLSPDLLNKVLVDMAHDRDFGTEFVASLSVAGRDGTLWRRLRDQEGRLRGKTGTINGIHCLTGYLDGAGDRRYAFAFLVNDIRGSSYKVKQLHERMARLVFDHGPVEADVADQDEGADDGEETP